MTQRATACTWTDQRASGLRLIGAVTTALLAVAWSGVAGAVDYRWGEVEARLDSFVSASMSMRVQNRDCMQIAQANGGCNVLSNPVLHGQLNGRLLNSDDGNLNVDKGDVYSVLVSVSHDLDVKWRDYGVFARVLYFYDVMQSHNHSGHAPRRTDLSDAARFRWGNVVEGGVVGADVRLLDAYAYANFRRFDRHLELRFGNQVINWGEEYFAQGGIKATSALDVSKLRVAGAELKEGLVPAPIVRLSVDVIGELTLETYYQFDWHPTQVDPVGTFFAVSDVVARGAEGQFTLQDPGTNGIAASTILNMVFVPNFANGGAPRAATREADGQGQWGAALRYYLEAIETEFGLYYVRLHDKQPTVSFRGTGLGARQIEYFTEYKERINLYGLSFNTTLLGVALGGELSFRPNQPTPVSDAFTDLFFGMGGVGEVGGAVREKRLMAIVNGLWVPGPATPLIGPAITFMGADDLNFIAEFALAHYPDLSDRAYAPPNAVLADVNMIVPFVGLVRNVWRPDDTSFGYQLRLAATYSRVCGSPITLTPSVSFRHDPYGTTPDSGVTFTEGIKKIGLQLEADYQNSWGALVSYSNSFGGGRANTDNDRDFVQFSVSYAF